MNLVDAQFDELCRTCAKSSSNLRFLFENQNDGETLVEKILICTQIHIDYQTNRPSKICDNCVDQVERAYEFQQCIKNSERSFQQMVTSKPNNKRISKRNAIRDPFGIVDVKIEIGCDEINIEPTVVISGIPESSDIKDEYVKCGPTESEPTPKRAKKYAAKQKAVTPKKRTKENKNQTFECYKCKENFTSYWKTSVHLKQHDAEEKFKCTICGARFILSDDFNRHLCQGDSIQCSYCSETFFATIALLNHLDRSHDKKTLFKCEKCAQFYSMSLLREMHMQQHADIETEDTKPFSCNVCGKRFANKYLLRSHEDIHSDKKPFLCFECGKSFKTRPSLHTHRIGHSEKTLKCPDCPMTFNRIAGFRKHRDVHLNLSYKCNICNAELRSKDALERHTRRHRLTDDDKRHHCTFCPKKFYKRDKLTRHLRTHTGEKPFKCPFCSDRAYAQKGDLTKHIKLKHVGNQIYTCEICKEGFQYFADLKTHTFEHYKEDKAKQETTS